MRVAKEPAHGGESPLGKGLPRLQGYLAAALAVGWLMVPAVQYYGAVRRTALQLSEPGGEIIAGLDLAPAYVLLLAATLLYVAARVLAGRRPPGPRNGSQEADS